MANRLLEEIKHRVLLGDGAMGTQLQLAGLLFGACGEIWNVEHPDRVLKIQKAYVDAGSDCLITNTFGGCRITLARHGHEKDVAAVNRQGAKIAREAFGDKKGFVLGDIGPFGGLMEPYGEIPEAAVREAFNEQADVLVNSGVDAIIIETQTALEELGIAIEAAQKAGSDCIIASLSFDVLVNGQDMKTMMGIDPERAAIFAKEAGAHIIAVNCGTGIDMPFAARCVKRYKAVCDLPTMAQPNGGVPELVGDKVCYRQTPKEMADEVQGVLESGVNILGACCGSTPAHIAAIRPLIDAWNAKRAN